MTKSLEIIDYQPVYKQRWKEINEAWVASIYFMEEVDHQHCSHPETSILAGGGQIMLGMFDGEVVGTAALLKESDATYELIKMAVDERFQGRGFGKALCQAAIERARDLGASLLYLLSNTKGSGKAIELYKKMGFVEAPLGHAEWERADIRMDLRFG